MHRKCRTMHIGTFRNKTETNDTNGEQRQSQSERHWKGEVVSPRVDGEGGLSSTLLYSKTIGATFSSNLFSRCLRFPIVASAK